MELQDRLIDYFRGRENKYIVLSNGTEVKLVYISGVSNRNLALMFEHERSNIKIEFSFFSPKNGGFILMEIPEGYYDNTQIRVDSMNHIGFVINEVLCNWTENKDDIGLEWK